MSAARPGEPAKERQREPQTANPSTPAADVRRTIVVPWDSIITAPEPEWLIDGIIPQGSQVHLLAPAGEGKSLLALHAAIAVCEGSQFIGAHQAKKGRVLWLDFENGLGILRDRIESYGYPLSEMWWFVDKFFFAPFPDMESLNTKEAEDTIAAEVARHRIDLVVIDSMGLAFGGDENSSDGYREFGRNLGARMRQDNVTLLMLDNTGKDAVRGGRGSSRKKDEADIQWSLSKLDETNFSLVNVKDRMGICPKRINVAKLEDPQLRWQATAPGRLSDGARKIIQSCQILGVTPTSVRDARSLGVTGKNRYLSEAVQSMKTQGTNDFLGGNTHG